MHAFLITAYQDPDQLASFLEDLGRGAAIYIHYDRRSDLDDKAASLLKDHSNVRSFSRRYKVNWGGLNHLKAILHLVREALKDRSVERLHLITGSDRMVTTWQGFNDFFEEHRPDEFLEHFPLPTAYWQGGGLDRLTRFHLLDLLDAKDPVQKKLLDLSVHLQRKIGVERSLRDLPPLYGGSTYWSLTRECLAHVLERCDRDPHLLRRFRMTHVPEEIFFQTVVMDSPYAQKVINDDLRYVSWERRNGSKPAILDMTDLPAIRSSGDLFARKFISPISDDLIAALRSQTSSAAE